MRTLTAREATHVERPERGPWEWPEPVGVMISDSYKVTRTTGERSADGEPLAHAYAVNFLEALYRYGWTLSAPDAETHRLENR